MNEIYVPLIQTNDQKNFISQSGHQEPAKIIAETVTCSYVLLSVIDKETLKLIQVLRLHKAIDHTVELYWFCCAVEVAGSAQHRFGLHTI